MIRAVQAATRRLHGTLTLFVALALAPVLLGWALVTAIGGVEKRSLPRDDPATTLILVTLDGVRPQELLHGADPSLAPDRAGEPVMPFLTRSLAPLGGFIAGDGRFGTGTPFATSMPSYHAMFTGRMTTCLTNECREPRGEGLLSRLVDLAPGSVAVFATWTRLCFGLPAERLANISVCGRDQAFAYLRRHGAAADVEGNADAMIFRAALSRLRLDPPSFLYIALDESDGAGHSGVYPAYLGVLARYDGYLRALWSEMQAMRARGLKPVLVVTTDHGRGDGAEWTGHGFTIPASREGWLLAVGHGIAAQGRAAGTRHRSLFDVRPTVEHLLGLVPRRSLWGGVMTELLAYRG